MRIHLVHNTTYCKLQRLSNKIILELFNMVFEFYTSIFTSQNFSFIFKNEVVALTEALFHLCCFCLKAFIAHACCQGLLLRIWNGALRGSNFRVLLGIICPLTILWMGYRQDYSYGMSGWKLKKKWWLKFYYFYTAPVTKFWLNVVS